MESKLVSYIIPIWEKSSVEELESRINSLIPEDPLIKEIIIVFDGYKSFNKKIIFPKKFFKKLKFIYCGINNGPGIARNKGVIFSKSEYILFLDCGDQSVPNRANIQIKSLNKNDVSLLDVELVKVFTGQDFIIRRHGKKYFEEINKCLVILLELKLINRLIYYISFSILFITRSLLPKKILSLIYRLLRK